MSENRKIEIRGSDVDARSRTQEDSALKGSDGPYEAEAKPDRCEREERAGLTATPPEVRQPFPFELPDRYSTESIDRSYKAHLARFTLGVTPFGLGSTVFKWWLHLLGSPGKHAFLAEKAARKIARYMIFAGKCRPGENATPCIEPLPHDSRFDDEAWRRYPYNLAYQAFLLTQQWWHNATNDVEGLSQDEERVVSFVTRQLLDVASPSNYVWSNPEVLQRTMEQGGVNLVEGAQHFFEDWERAVSGKLPVGADEYAPGRDVATAEGKVVYRNHLIELIQYAPKTAKVKAEPVLFVPAWIMKYYILDLSPHNSLVKYLVEEGYTVFIISWRNPTAEDRDRGMADYIDLGVGRALDAVCEITANGRVHGVGYCIGGTLLSIAAAAMARDGDDRFKTLTFFATQTDFTEPGELGLFISESEVSYLENMMWDQGYLDTKQMAGAFQLLRSNDLIWSRYVHEYLMGKRQQMFDLMAWNADATRMPYKMHSEYLRRIFLNNELAQGQYEVDERPVAIADISAPIFSVSTMKDHVAPWKSVYKIHLLADADVTFVLTSGGHNAGIVSEPGHEGRRFQIGSRKEGDSYLSPELWREDAREEEGSWWPAWSAWLAEHSSEEVSPPAFGGGKRAYRPKCDAPGTYVFQK